jgi:predicted amidophosphoribosyltransferase
MLPVPTYTQYIRCPNCGSQVASFSNYCNYCGASLRQPILLKICAKCLTRIPAASKFCPECGKKQEFNISKKPIVGRRQTSIRFSSDRKQEEKPQAT